MKCSTAREIQNVKHTLPFHITIANSTRKTKIISEDQVVANSRRYTKTYDGIRRNLRKHDRSYTNYKNKTLLNCWKLSLYMPRSSFETLKLDTNNTLTLVFALQTTRCRHDILSTLRKHWPTSHIKWPPSQMVFSHSWLSIHRPPLYNAQTTPLINFLVTTL